MPFRRLLVFLQKGQKDLEKTTTLLLSISLLAKSTGEACELMWRLVVENDEERVAEERATILERVGPWRMPKAMVEDAKVAIMARTAAAKYFIVELWL